MILLVNSAGFYAYYIVQLRKLHAEAREKIKGLPEHQLDLLILTPQQYREARVDDHEVKVDGKMYDIGRIIKKSKLLYIYCVHDDKEDDLLALFSDIVSKPLDVSSRVPAVVVDFISLNFLLQQNELSLINPCADLIARTTYSFPVLLIDPQNITPPPKH